MTEWPRRKIQFEQRNNPFILAMFASAARATAALEGLAGKDLEDAAHDARKIRRTSTEADAAIASSRHQLQQKNASCVGATHRRSWRLFTPNCCRETVDPDQRR